MIEIIEIESREHARKLAKEGGMNHEQIAENAAKYYGELLKEKGIDIEE